MRLNEATWLVADELTADWEELRERWKTAIESVDWTQVIEEIAARMRSSIDANEDD